MHPGPSLFVHALTALAFFLAWPFIVAAAVVDRWFA